MTFDTTKQVFTYLYAILVFAGVFYALVIYPYQLDDLVKGALIGWATLAINSVFSDQVASRTAKQSEDASASGAAQAMTIPPAQGSQP